MRITGGEARGRPLSAPRGDETRPTSDKVRQALMNVLGQRFDGLAVLDLYAGSGALGLEALSRGAARAVFVDSARAAILAVEENAARTGFADRASVHGDDALRWAARAAGQGARFDVVFADPPYALRALAKIAEACAPLLAEGGRLVVEHDRREDAPAEVAGLSLAQDRRYGDTCLAIFGRR